MEVTMGDILDHGFWFWFWILTITFWIGWLCGYIYGMNRGYERACSDSRRAFDECVEDLTKKLTNKS